MKKGTGDDPFAEPEPEPATEPDLDPVDVADVEDVRIPEPPRPAREDAGVPWVYRRQTVKERRDMVQFYLRDEVRAAEEELVDAVASEVGADVSMTDVREAAYVAAMRDVEAIADELRRWGFEDESMG